MKMCLCVRLRGVVLRSEQYFKVKCALQDLQKEGRKAKAKSEKNKEDSKAISKGFSML